LEEDCASVIVDHQPSSAPQERIGVLDLVVDVIVQHGFAAGRQLDLVHLVRRHAEMLT
jgi:hypothetical protein